MRMISGMWLGARHKAIDMLADRRGIAATEFAVIVPIMLVLFFGTVEFSSGVAVDRKVTLIARALSDLTAQTPPPSLNSTSATMTDTYLQNVFTASISIIAPYAPSPVKATLTEIYVDSNQIAKVQWSKSAIINGDAATQATLMTSTLHQAGDVVTSIVPSNLLVRQTYLILSEVSYLYVPTIGYVMAKSGITLQDKAYTRPRQAYCVIYNSVPADPCPST
ncbi:MAG: TadE/TadG family type IV pilus assembly protein [Xanthobacteraceae bacterium]